MKKLLLFLMLLASATVARANTAAHGWCEQGGTVVVLSGLQSTNTVQGSFPSCTITVLIHGGGLATLFSNSTGTPLANPFTAQSNGQWTFYAANGNYDITMTGGGLPSPITYSDVQLNDLFTGTVTAAGFQVTASGQSATMSSDGISGEVAFGTGGGDFSGSWKATTGTLFGHPAVLNLTDSLGARVWQLRNGSTTNLFEIFDSTDNKTLLSANSTEVRIGTTTNIVANQSRMYIFGGANGANVDIQGDGTTVDQAVVEMEGSDYATHTNSALVKYSGLNAIGSTNGFTNVNLAQFVCGGTCANMLVGSNTTAPVVFTTNAIERMRLLNGFQLNIGLNGTGSGILGLNGSTSGTATLTAPAVAGTITNPIAVSNSLNLPSGTVLSWNSDTGFSRTGAGAAALGNGTAGDTTGNLQLNQVTKYLGTTTVGAGIPSIVANVNVTGQQANIGSTLLYAVPANGGGMYRVMPYLVVTQAATTSSTLPILFVGFTDFDSNVAEANQAITVTNSLNQVGITNTFAQGGVSAIFYAHASSNINYQTGSYASSGATPMQYAVRIKLEYLGN